MQLLRFAWVEATCCLFAGLFFLGLALVRVVPLPMSQGDALLLWCLAVTAVLWLLGWETGREVAVIAGFHLVGLALEVFKVHVGSWSYPSVGVATVAGVPLYSGFMYASVGSYVCQAWRRMDLRISAYRPVLTFLTAAAVYANFFTEHFVADLRLPLALLLLAVQLDWTLVHPAKLGSWSLLVVVSIVLVAAVKATEGRLYGAEQDRTVWTTGRYDVQGPVALTAAPARQVLT